MQYNDHRIIDYILGNQNDFPLEGRVLNAAMFASGIVNTIFFIQTVLSGFSFKAFILILIATSIFWVMYGLGRSRREYNWLIWAYLFFNYIIILIDWFFVGGYTGVAFPVLMALTGIMPVITKPKQLPHGYLSLGIVFIIIVLSYVFSFDSIPKHTPNLKRAMEQSIEIIILSLALALITYLAVSAFRLQKEKSLTLNREMEQLNRSLEDKNRRLEDALQEVKTLRGIIPICSNCKKIRNDEGYYEVVEQYVARYTEADFSHTVCPDCMKELYPDIYEKIKSND